MLNMNSTIRGQPDRLGLSCQLSLLTHRNLAELWRSKPYASASPCALLQERSGVCARSTHNTPANTPAASKSQQPSSSHHSFERSSQLHASAQHSDAPPHAESDSFANNTDGSNRNNAPHSDKTSSAHSAVTHALAQHSSIPDHRSSGTVVSSRNSGSSDRWSQTVPEHLLMRQAIALYSSGAVLGPFCDSLHSSHDVLHYHNPWLLTLPEHAFGYQLETCWWVPLLFGVAGVILGVSYPVLDRIGPLAVVSRPLSSISTLTAPDSVAVTNGSKPKTSLDHTKRAAAVIDRTPQLNSSSAETSTVEADASVADRREGYPQEQAYPAPGWPAVLACISFFVLQYALSGVLEGTLLHQQIHLADGTAVPQLDVILAMYAMTHWAVFDRTKVGLLMSCVTAMAGPVIEILLINQAGLYHYSHPDLWGVPSWIPSVYFCGGPAVGNLGRRVWAELKAAEQAPVMQ